MTALDEVRAFARENDIDIDDSADSCVLTIAGVHRLRINVAFVEGAHTLRVESFVARNPDENHEVVYRWLLEQNARLMGVAFAIDRFGDVYLSGALRAETVNSQSIDQLLGIVVATSDAAFNTLIELGFRSAIEREWAWRTSRGLPADNLAAFAHLFPTEAD